MALGHLGFHLPEKLNLALLVCLSFLLGCSADKEVYNVLPIYKDGKAVNVQFHSSNLNDLKVYLKRERATPVLGTFHSEKNSHLFIPVLPFSPGQTYEIRRDTTVLASFSIAEKSKKELPEIVHIYPSTDTVPENLLKVYVKFSHPMQAVGRALDYISVYNETLEREEDIFLQLESELWNKEHTLLTLWLDPGRIKTDLIPNKEKGLPIQKGNTYSIRFSNNWRSAEGVELKKSYTKTIEVTEKDKRMPTLTDWKFSLPRVLSRSKLSISFPEAMDAVLLSESVRILDAKEVQKPGIFLLGKSEKELIFQPYDSWEKGDYTLEVKSILEDLGGNNLNGLFDRDITSSVRDSSRTKVIKFRL